jgi:septal ring factor EnvC (AmiA/AmiB activator)
MKKNKSGIASILLLVLPLLLCLSFSLNCFAEELPETITMSREQFIELWVITERSESRLIKLSNILELQKKKSNELMELTEEQHLSYQKAESELTKGKELLQNSNKTIAEQNKSLEILSSQIKKEKSRSELKQKQKAFWGFAGGVLVGAIAASR